MSGIVTPIKLALKREGETLVENMAKRARTYAKKKLRTFVKTRARRVLKRATKRVKASTRSFRALSKVRSGYVNRAFNTEITVTSNTLFTSEILSTLTQGSQNDQRRGNKILLKGISWSMEWNNGAANLPIYVNFAVLTPLQGAGVDDTNFFRDLDVENNADFSSPSLSGWNKHTRALNRDKYIIHFHKRFWLGGRVAGTAGASSCRRESYRSMKFYQRLNSHVTFSTQGGSELPDQKMVICIWYNRAFTGLPGAAITGTTDLKCNFETMIYFNNV